MKALLQRPLSLQPPIHSRTCVRCAFPVACTHQQKSENANANSLHPLTIEHPHQRSLLDLGPESHYLFATIVGGEAGKRVVMRSPCAVAALDPPLWTVVPNKALSSSLSLLHPGRPFFLGLRLMGALSLTRRKPRRRSGLHSTPGLASTVHTVPGVLPRRCTPGFHRSLIATVYPEVYPSDMPPLLARLEPDHEYIRPH